MTLARPLRLTLLSLLLLAGGLAAVVFSLSWQPPARQEIAVSCQAQAVTLQPGQALKVLTWNLRALAGQPPLTEDSAAQRSASLDAAVNVLRDEQADILLLQELHDGAAASDYQDQLALLQERLGDLYPCSTQAFYWKAAFVPQQLGSVGSKLVILSRYQILGAERLQLPRRPGNPLSRSVRPQRALLLGHLPIRGGGTLTLLNTQLDAPAEDDDSHLKQLAMTARLLDRLQADNSLWLLGGDFNTPRLDGNRQPDAGQDELAQLAGRYPTIPGRQLAKGTSDYLLHSPSLTALDWLVRQHDTQAISDHQPVIARLLLPPLD